MKKYIRFTTAWIMITIFWNSLMLNVNAEEEPNDSNYQNIEQQELTSDYNTVERIKAREAKIEAMYKNRSVQNARASYTIALPLRAQENKYYCGPASGKMLIDYQLGNNNAWTQSKIAGYMGTTTGGTTVWNAASALRTITGLNFEAQKISELPLINALKTDINAYVGVMVMYNVKSMYGKTSSNHFSAAKGYSGSTVTYLDPYKFDSSMYGQHEVSLTKMTSAITAGGGYYIW